MEVAVLPGRSNLSVPRFSVTSKRWSGRNVIAHGSSNWTMAVTLKGSASATAAVAAGAVGWVERLTSLPLPHAARTRQAAAEIR